MLYENTVLKRIPSEKTRPESLRGNYMGKTITATKCNEQPSQATAKPRRLIQGLFTVLYATRVVYSAICDTYMY